MSPYDPLACRSDTDSELRSKGVTVTGSGIAIKLDKQAPTRGELVGFDHS